MREVKAKDLIADMRSGMTGDKLMKKYRLTPKGLHSVFTQLADATNIVPADLYGRSETRDGPADIAAIRMVSRSEIILPLRINETADPFTEGIVRDISEKGMGVSGLPAKVGETKTFVVHADEFFRVGRFTFDAVCRWVKEDPTGSAGLAGFEIADISSTSSERLRQLLEIVSYIY